MYCGVGNGSVKNLVYTHPADKQCNYSVDTSNFVTKDEIEEPLTIKMYNESLLTDNENSGDGHITQILWDDNYFIITLGWDLSSDFSEVLGVSFYGYYSVGSGSRGTVEHRSPGFNIISRFPISGNTLRSFSFQTVGSALMSGGQRDPDSSLSYTFLAIGRS